LARPGHTVTSEGIKVSDSQTRLTWSRWAQHVAPNRLNRISRPRSRQVRRDRVSQIEMQARGGTTANGLLVILADVGRGGEDAARRGRPRPLAGGNTVGAGHYGWPFPVWLPRPALDVRSSDQRPQVHSIRVPPTGRRRKLFVVSKAVKVDAWCLELSTGLSEERQTRRDVSGAS